MALTTCNECRREISDTVKSCPHCGKRNPASRQGPSIPGPKPARIAVGVLAAFALIVLLAHWLGGPDNTTSSSADVSQAQASTQDDASSDATAQAPRPIYRTTADALNRAYAVNEVATQDRMNGKTIVVSGVIHSIDEGFTGDAEINLDTSDPYTQATMDLKDSQKPLAAGLRKGQPVSVSCSYAKRILESPTGYDCVIDSR